MMAGFDRDDLECVYCPLSLSSRMALSFSNESVRAMHRRRWRSLPETASDRDFPPVFRGLEEGAGAGPGVRESDSMENMSSSSRALRDFEVDAVAVVLPRSSLRRLATSPCNSCVREGPNKDRHNQTRASDRFVFSIS